MSTHSQNTDPGIVPAKSRVFALLSYALAIAGALGFLVLFLIFVLSPPDSGVTVWVTLPPLIAGGFFWMTGDLLKSR